MTHTLLDSRRVASPAGAQLCLASVAGNSAKIRRFGGPQKEGIWLNRPRSPEGGHPASHRRDLIKVRANLGQEFVIGGDMDNGKTRFTPPRGGGTPRRGGAFSASAVHPHARGDNC